MACRLRYSSLFSGKGIHKANKQMRMAATAYNLKKRLKYATSPRSVAESMKAGHPLALLKSALSRLILPTYTHPNFTNKNLGKNKKSLLVALFRFVFSLFRGMRYGYCYWDVFLL